VVTHQLQVERRTGKVRQSETDVLPLCHATILFIDNARIACAAGSIKLSSVRLSVCPVYRPLQQRAAGLLLGARWAGDISQQRRLPDAQKHGAQQQYTIKFVKRHVAVASEALANRTVKKHRRMRTNVL